MKYVLALLVLIGIAEWAYAEGPGALGLRKPVNTATVLDTSATNVTTSAYVTLAAVAAVPQAYSAILVANTGSSPLGIALGAAAAEKDTGLVIPPASYVMLPYNGPNKTRLSVKSLSGTQSTGLVTISFFQ